MIGSAATTTVAEVAVGGVERPVERVPEHLGVGEEERRVEAEEKQARDLRALGVPLCVVVALERRHPPEHGRVGMPRPFEHGDHREGHGEPDAGEDPETSTPTNEATASAKSRRFTRRSHAGPARR